jgi:hypothetical protein
MRTNAHTLHGGACRKVKEVFNLQFLGMHYKAWNVSTSCLRHYIIQRRRLMPKHHLCGMKLQSFNSYVGVFHISILVA